jgi:lambda family phage portal protein
MTGHAAAVSRALFGITHGEPVRRPRPSPHLARYDAADTNDGNERHWADADWLSAKAANSPGVRQRLRMRARLEADNNGNCKGAIETIGHDMIGTGPRLQLTLPTPDGGAADTTSARQVERRFNAWAHNRVVDLPDKLRVKVESELRDGESFGLFTTNPKVPGPVQLDLRVVETDQVETPWLFNPTDPNQVSGIVFDRYGNPEYYHVLKYHPGDQFVGSINDYTQVPAASVVHWFRPTRAGQARGIPRITPGLSLLAQLRGYARSVMGAARIAAMFAALMETNLPPESGVSVDVEAYDKIPLDHDGMFTLPAGWKASQLHAEQPTTSYAQFSDYHLTQFGRGIHVPRNVVTGDSSGYNFSSARLDHLIYRGAMRIERNRLRTRVLDPVFLAWVAEALLVPDYLPAGLPPVEDWLWTWQYDGTPSINPVDDANAAEIELRNGLTDHATELAEAGVDWEERFEAMARQRQRARELDIEDMLWPARRTGVPVGADANAGAAPPTPAPPRAQAEVDTVLEEEAALA